MTEGDPISSKLQEKSSEISEEVKLKKKSRKANRLVICTSVVLLFAVLSSLFRILLNMLG